MMMYLKRYEYDMMVDVGSMFGTYGTCSDRMEKKEGVEAKRPMQRPRTEIRRTEKSGARAEEVRAKT